MSSSSSSTLLFPFLVLEFAIKDLGTKLIFPPKRELVVKPFLLMYISITINHDLGTKLFFCVWKGRLSNPFLLMHISITINQGLGTNLIFAGKVWLSNPFLLMHITISQVINIWVQTWFSLEKGRLSNPFLTYSQIDHNY